MRSEDVSMSTLSSNRSKNVTLRDSGASPNFQRRIGHIEQTEHRREKDDVAPPVSIEVGVALEGTSPRPPRHVTAKARSKARCRSAETGHGDNA